MFVGPLVLLSQNSIVGTASSRRIGRAGFRIPSRARDFCPKPPDRLWGPHSLLFSRYWGSFPEVKRPGREVYYSPSSRAEVKSYWMRKMLPLPLTFMHLSHIMKTLISMGYHSISFTRAAIICVFLVFWQCNYFAVFPVWVHLQYVQLPIHAFRRYFVFWQTWEELHKMLGKGTDFKWQPFMALQN